MALESPMVYWLNPMRPDYQYRTNGLMCQRLKIGETRWLAHETVKPSWPSEFRYQVDEKELQREEVKVSA